MTIIKTIKPNPGSNEAQKIGCKCPVIDNHYSKGYHGVRGEFVYNMDCPIHTMKAEELQEMLGIKS